MNKKAKKILGWTTGTAAVAAIALAAAVENYGKPTNHKWELEAKRKELAKAEDRYARIQDWVIEEAKEAMPFEEELRTLHMFENAYTGEDAEYAQKRIAELEAKRDSVISERLSTDFDLARAEENCADLMIQISALQRDSVRRAEIAKRTFSQQWNTVVNDLKTKSK